MLNHRDCDISICSFLCFCGLLPLLHYLQPQNNQQGQSLFSCSSHHSQIHPQSPSYFLMLLLLLIITQFWHFHGEICNQILEKLSCFVYWFDLVSKSIDPTQSISYLSPLLILNFHFVFAGPVHGNRISLRCFAKNSEEVS